MTERKDLWWVLPASLALVVLILVSGAGNFIYGLDFGGPIIGAASIASDLIKVVALIGVFALWRNRHRWQASALFLLFAGFTVWSMISAVGFMSSKFATLQDTRGKTASAWQELTSEMDRLKSQRDKVKDVRPQATIEADINAIMRLPGINGCAVIDGPVTRQHCPRYDELKAELGHAQAAIWIDGRLANLRKELKSTDHVSVVDPRTDSLAAATGLAASSVVLFIKFFIAGLIESATAFGLWAVWSPFFGRASAQKAAESLQKAPEALAVSLATRSPRGPVGMPEVIEKAQARPQIEAPVETPPEGGGTPKADEPEVTAPEPEPTTVVNFPAPPKPLSKREKLKQKKREVDSRNRELVEGFIAAHLDTDHPLAQIELTDKGGWRSGGTSMENIYQAFRRYCKAHGETAMSKSHCGRLVSESIDKARGVKGIFYGAVIRSEQKRKVA